MRRKSPIQLPFADPQGHLPADFDSMEHVLRMLAEHKPMDYTPDARLIGELIGGRFLLKHAPATDETTREVFIVGYFRVGMTWVPVAECSNELLALRCAEEWAGLTTRELMKALWIARDRPAVPDLCIPSEARIWHQLPVAHRAQLWRLIESGAPGSIVDLIAAARACDLFI